MADEYIRKQDAVDAVKHAWAKGIEPSQYIKSLEPADVAPVVHSQWKYKNGEIHCPECENKIYRINLSGCLHFCPNCGAKMDREE